MKVARKKTVVSDRKPSRKASSADLKQLKVRALDVAPSPETTGPRWTFLTNHSHVLVLLSRNPSVVLREVASQVGITERAVQRLISDLESCGVLTREKVGRQNYYRIRVKQPLRHSIESHRTVGDLLALINDA
jgi:DNA-binding transcriptional ArsR family regulator